MKVQILVALALIALALPAAAEPLDVHVIVYLPNDIDAISAVEFDISNLPFDQCYIEQSWDTTLMIGSLGDGGIALAFIDPLTGPVAHLGVLRFTCLEPIGDDYVIEVVPSASGNLVVVDAEDSSEVDVEGGFFTFNNVTGWYCSYNGGGIALDLDPSGWGDTCADLLPETTPVDNSSWGSIKSLY